MSTNNTNDANSSLPPNCSIFSVQIENHLVTQTVELMNHTNRVKSMIDLYNEEMVRKRWTGSLDAGRGNCYLKFFKLFFLTCNQVYMANQRQVLPTITLSADTKACLEELGKPIVSPFEMTRIPSDFTRGKPKSVIQITKPVVMEVLGKALVGMLRVKGFDCKYGHLLKQWMIWDIT